MTSQHRYKYSIDSKKEMNNNVKRLFSFHNQIQWETLFIALWNKEELDNIWYGHKKTPNSQFIKVLHIHWVGMLQF